MVYTLEQKTFLVESYLRSGTKVDGVRTYSVQNCIKDFRREFPKVVVSRQF
ncbi:hypothetical protein BDFB_014039 [Asbolus verrucosus]|uniref:DUF4817 domain-containing protein n=1 Tax=Asbolus verrucosus TaxID=1661398 RepID=A0A482VDE9_ASBVE|nr:hypothetical protein BDFB_014039 [Asbolus verrucosus]